MPRFNTLKDWLTWQESLHPLAIDMGLERAARVFAALDPDYRKPVTITVAGTNGKGSCVAYLETIYRAQGYRVGAYTSPHILRYNERIKIDGLPAADELICEAFARIEAVRDDTSLSYFEFSTLAALDIFSRRRVDIQILEVGMGGRLDAVNIIDPDVALISSIGIDHVDWLGQTREAIGAEKAGIFRAGIPAIVGDPEPPASLLQCAQNKNAKLFRIGKEFGYRKTANGWHWRCADQSLENLPPPSLKGEHQYRNAASAILAVRQLSPILPVDIAAIRQSLENVKLAGRFQLINDKIPFLLDVGHNPEAVKTLVEYLREHCRHYRVRALFSMMKDKDIKGVLELMNPLVYDWFFAPLTNPRAANEAQMRSIFEQCGISAAHFGFQTFNEAFAAAKTQLQEGDLLLVFGSFFLVSDCLSALDKGE
ncbi:bifunctional tetrahydrofolate synthase/dihydrofolate synthase [Candidatus Methylomicrobium oryzae]|jgi:dihydrofolate synthase/folylpolyglutamate synthase|uniref:bifunctional tetrahydrofolate synthase/dihydrofolate synthase n=1 Tax=Candidatus Methylomicrobium oryzae TaxID=2802053 RepID=UPI001923991F|nr:bifunctional tetrahydrofolate synthase/dihydrofolate synthase [Methylomicrobium sp. RS1]MBL1262390.1 bifunctional tetrahydrofolate synthase/dihydrofolate synthase [Methylomicrobium sp. RS1]